MQKFSTINKFTEYNTSYNQDNAPETILVTGSKNCMIDGRNGKVRSRPGYSRLGASNTAGTPIRNAKTWNTSKGTHLPIRFYDDEWEIYLETVDGTIINAWTRFSSSMSTTAIPRLDFWYDATEDIDLAIIVQGDSNLYEFNGAIAIVGSIPDGTHVTKTSTSTWAQNRFYTTRNKTMVCVRTGTVYTYTAGETGTNLTVTDSTGLIAGDILVQSVVTRSNSPASSRNNHTIGVHENQIAIGSEEDEVVYISKNTSYYDFTYSSPRVAGEGGLLTLTDPTRGFGHLANDFIIFVGTSSAFKAVYQSITVGSTLTESLTALPLKIGVNQGAFNQECIVQVGNGLIYLTNEPAIIQLESSVNATEPILHSLSNPIKPDFDAEDFTNACAIWYKNSYWLSAQVNSHTYILEVIEDADGNIRKFWQPPQVLPVRAFSIIDDVISGHSNAVPETYTLLDGLSDTGSDDTKFPISWMMKFAYRSFKDRANLKSFDEFYVEGEITQNTNDCLLDINYDFGGHTQMIERTIDGSDEGILEENIGASSLAQESLGVDSLAGLLNPPSDARKFRVIFEIAKEDFHEMQAVISCDEADRYVAILSMGPNATMSPRRDIGIRR